MSDEPKPSAEEIERRRDAMLLRALKTPPQPRKKRDRGQPTNGSASSETGGKRAPTA